jgi:hypothetical protein
VDDRSKQKQHLIHEFPAVPEKAKKKKKSTFLGRGAKNIRNFVNKLLRMGALDGSEADPEVVKAQIPRACFTKKGPGRDHSAKRAYACMSVEQRELALRKGWLPQAFSALSDNDLKRLKAR